MEVFEIYVPAGRKTIYGIEQTPGTVTIRLDCDVYEMAVFNITTEQAREIFNPNRTRHVQDILPDVAPPLRECFVSGITPAEFDAQFRSKAKLRKRYTCYADET